MVAAGPRDALLEASLWHPVGLCSSLTDQPAAVQLLGQGVVLWRDAAGLARAGADRCPHRGARLSLGRVEAGLLECAYHGWRFDGQGQCTLIPALPQLVPSGRYRACSYEAREAYGLVWVRLQAPPDAAAPLPVHDFPVFQADADARLRKVNCGPYSVATSAPRVVENFLDVAHFGFVHEGWLGNREAVSVGHYKVAATAHGVLATDCVALQPRSSVHATGLARVEYTYEVIAPYAAVLTKIPEAGSASVSDLRESIALWVNPVSPESCVVWMRLAMNDFDSPDQRLIDFQDTIFGQDLPVLESQQPKRLPLRPDAELHSAADRTSTAYRQFLMQTGITFGVTR